MLGNLVSEVKYYVMYGNYINQETIRIIYVKNREKRNSDTKEYRSINW